MRHGPTSPFDHLETTFRFLGSGPHPLSLDGRLVGTPLPPHDIALGELRDRLLMAGTPHGVRNRAVGILLSRAQAERSTASIALCGLLLPGLRKVTGPRKAVLPECAADIEAEALAGVLKAVEELCETTPKLAWELVAAGLRGVDRFVGRELTVLRRHMAGDVASLPAPLYGHPDLVLVAAVEDGVIRPDDAFVIGETRLGGATLEEVARSMQVGTAALQKRRRRAEEALACWLRTGYVRNRLPRTPSRSAGRPRHGRRLADIARTDRLSPEEVIQHPSGRLCEGEVDPHPSHVEGEDPELTTRGAFVRRREHLAPLRSDGDWQCQSADRRPAEAGDQPSASFEWSRCEVRRTA